MTKVEALAKFLNCEVDDISGNRFDDNTFDHGREEYLVLTDDEADDKARENILDSVWAFKPSFLESHMTDVTEEMITLLQEKCEDATPLLLRLIDDKDHFVDAAISSDGRGHFLNTYDNEEHEVTWKDSDNNLQFLYIYRTN